MSVSFLSVPYPRLIAGSTQEISGIKYDACSYCDHVKPPSTLRLLRYQAQVAPLT